MQPSNVLAARAASSTGTARTTVIEAGRCPCFAGLALEREHGKGRQRATLLHRLACAGRNDVNRIARPDRRGKAFRRIERNCEGDCPLRHGRPDIRSRYTLPRRNIAKQHVADQLFRCFGQAKQSRRPALLHGAQLGRADRREKPGGGGRPPLR